MNMETETGRVLPQTKEFLDPPKMEKAGMGRSHPKLETDLADTLISDFWPLKL